MKWSIASSRKFTPGRQRDERTYCRGKACGVSDAGSRLAAQNRSAAKRLVLEILSHDCPAARDVSVRSESLWSRKCAQARRRAAAAEPSKLSRSGADRGVSEAADELSGAQRAV